MIHLDYTVDWI